MIEEKSKIELIIDFLRNNRKTSIFFSLIIIVCFYIFFISPSKNFPLGQISTVYPGESLQEITKNLEKLEVIKSPFIFRSLVILMGGENKVKAGDYLFDKKENVFTVARRFVNGDFHIETVKMTIPEGWNVFQIAEYFEKNLINFDKNEFIRLAKSEEGYLFPDTYFVSPAIKPERIIELMKGTFKRRIDDISELKDADRSLEDIIKMASIIEAEARTTESRRTIAGILWKRIDIKMPLQVDVTFSYINGKNSYELTLNDLEIDSPYNTYKYRGLPPTPINNPGVDSIRSAATPIETKYLYFLSSKSGDMYYATTFDGHKKNKELYLDK